MNKMLQGLSDKAYSTSLPKFKTSESSIFIPGISAILPPRDLLLCFDGIKYWFKGGLIQFCELFCRHFLRAQNIETSTASIFEDVWVSDQLRWPFRGMV